MNRSKGAILKHIMNAWKNYGIKIEDIFHGYLGCSPSEIQPTVILAPYWKPELFHTEWPNQTEIHPNRVWEISITTNATTDDYSFTYIRTGIGAPLLGDIALLLTIPPLREKIKQVIFLGSVGGLDPQLSIGDLVLPNEALSGLGFSRYLTSSKLADYDAFGAEPTRPNQKLQELLLLSTRNYLANQNTADPDQKSTEIRIHRGRVFSLDTIAAQFLHLGEIIDLGCLGIEMETALFFDIMNRADIPAAALLLVSDNTVTQKSLFSGRTDAELALKQRVKKKVIPRIISQFLGRTAA